MITIGLKGAPLCILGRPYILGVISNWNQYFLQLMKVGFFYDFLNLFNHLEVTSMLLVAATIVDVLKYFFHVVFLIHNHYSSSIVNSQYYYFLVVS